MDRRILVSAVAVVLITLILGGAASDAKAAVGAADVLGGTGEDGSGEGRDLVSEKIYQLADKIAQISRIFIYLVGIFFVGRMLLIVFSSQIGVSGGKPGAIADMTSEMVFALLSFLLAVDTPRLAQAFVAIAMQNIDAATSPEISAMGTVVEPIAGFVIGLLGTLVFVGFAVNFVFAGTQAVVTAAIGNPGGISTGVSKALSLVFTLLLGFAFLRTGQWIFQNFFSL